MSECEYLARHRQRTRERAQQHQAERSADARSDRHYHAAMDVKMDKWLSEHPDATTGDTLGAIMFAAMDLLCPVPLFNVSRRIEKPYAGVIDVGPCWPPITHVTFTSEESES